MFLSFLEILKVHKKTRRLHPRRGLRRVLASLAWCLSNFIYFSIDKHFNHFVDMHTGAVAQFLSASSSCSRFYIFVFSLVVLVPRFSQICIILFFFRHKLMPLQASVYASSGISLCLFWHKLLLFLFSLVLAFRGFRAFCRAFWTFRAFRTFLDFHAFQGFRDFWGFLRFWKFLDFS